MKQSRCWKGYEPVKSKKAYSPGSCKKSTKTQSPKRKSNGKSKSK